MRSTNEALKTTGFCGFALFLLLPIVFFGSFFDPLETKQLFTVTAGYLPKLRGLSGCCVDLRVVIVVLERRMDPR